MDSHTKKKSCKYPNCNNSYYTNAVNKHFYRFPSNHVLHNRWKRCLKLDPSINCRNYIVCEDHFRKEDFVNASKHRLNHNVVPIEYFNDNDLIYHDHCYIRETTTIQDKTMSSTKEPPLINEHNYVRIEGPDLKNIRSISIPKDLPLPVPILIETNQPNQNLLNNPSDNINTRQLTITKSVNSIGTYCNLISPTIEEKFKNYEQIQKKLRSKIRLLQHRYNKSQRNLRELRKMLQKEDLIGLIRKRKFKCLSNLTEIGQMFIISQLKNASAKTPYARRYTDDELEFFVQLYRKSPAVYRFLDQYLILPSQRTIKSCVNKQQKQTTNEHNYSIDVGCDLNELEFFANEFEIQQ